MEQFERWFADARAALPHEATAMVFATADADGQPSARTVLLKGYDERGFVLYTNLTSRKGREALANPKASLVFPWYEIERQVVVVGRVEPVTAEESDAYFATRPRDSQLGAHASPQSTVIPDREVLETAFAELSERYPGEVPRPAHWGELRVVPETARAWGMLVAVTSMP